MVFILVIAGIIVVAAAVYAFWPHDAGVVDTDVRLAKRRDVGRGDYYRG
ncbi:hypothetical protein GCM10009798_40940 [Nocardioides panacihumi]|uniref:Uncharacterized protein n=1 Tax=Nocardioides panacihumi TaxID=400774 RepID=A0ABN2RV65_9ACTN